MHSGAGAVVNFSSESAHAAQAKRWVYPCTKAAIEELTRSQALDVAKDNIRVNAVIPGWTWSAPIKKAHEIGRAHVELQSLMRISYAVFCLKKKKKYNRPLNTAPQTNTTTTIQTQNQT